MTKTHPPYLLFRALTFPMPEARGIRYEAFLRVVPLVLLLAAGSSVEAQSDPSWQIAVGGLVGRPQGPLKEVAGDHASGATFSAGYRLKRLPLMLGVDLGSVDYQTLKLPTSPLLSAETSASIDLLHFLARIQSRHGAIRPYLDVLLGVSRPNVTTDILRFATASLPELSTTEQFSNTGFSYGGGAGLMLRVYNGSHKSKGLRAVSADFQMRYLSGSVGEYVNQGSLRLVGGRVVFDTAPARHELLNFGIGVVFDF